MHPVGVGSELAAVRAELLAAIDDPADRGTLQLPAVHSPRPLRPPGVGVDATMSARAGAGLDPAGPDHPDGRLWPRVVAPAAAGLGVDTVALTGSAVAWAVTRSAIAATVTVVTVPIALTLGVIAVRAARRSARDPLRLTEPQLRALTDSSHWQSARPWFGPVSATPERRLVGLAADAVRRVAGSPAWDSPYLDEHRGRVDLARELDEIDEQAFELARLRLDGPGERHRASLQRLGELLVDRVAALELYARRTVALEPALAEVADERRAELAEARVAGLFAAGARSELADDSLLGLGEQLAALQASITRPTG